MSWSEEVQWLLETKRQMAVIFVITLFTVKGVCVFIFAAKCILVQMHLGQDTKKDEEAAWTQMWRVSVTQAPAEQENSCNDGSAMSNSLTSKWGIRGQYPSGNSPCVFFHFLDSLWDVIGANLSTASV